ncbi:CAAX protease self-immunity domain-containing protein [Ditylenchus destructor]|nr:CAAX protease self-immunity domain-containing protein [Ditylenchus destructor]
MAECVCWAHALVAVLIPISYVGLIHVFDANGTWRNDPRSVKRRFAAVACNNVLALSVTWWLLKQSYADPFNQMGFRLSGILSASLFPTTLTALVYLGTWLSMYFDGSFKSMLVFEEWKKSFQDILWIRHTIVAPVTEEFAFRACSAVLVHHCFGWTAATFIAPLFFSISHFHHVLEDRKQGDTLNESLLRRGFQATYTYLFGVYATVIFLHTGHILAAILSHSLCNNLGLPDLNEIKYFPQKYRPILWTFHIIGFLLWTVFLTIFLRQPGFY